MTRTSPRRAATSTTSPARRPTSSSSPSSSTTSTCSSTATTPTSTARSPRAVTPSRRSGSKAREHRTTICATIFEEQGPGVYFDTAFFIGPDGEIIGKYRKTHPAAVQSLEKIYFRGGTRFPVVDVKGFKVGAVICYDHCFPETVRCCAVNGAELVVGPFAAPAFPTWDSLMITRAWENGVYLAPCNKVGPRG